jgi:hypothetical protein
MVYPAGQRGPESQLPQMLQLDLIGNSQVWETEELCCAWGGYGDSTAKRKEMQIIRNER